jgi:hypothetical protein
LDSEVVWMFTAWSEVFIRKKHSTVFMAWHSGVMPPGFLCDYRAGRSIWRQLSVKG